MSTQPYPDRGQGPAQKQSTAPVNSLLVADCGAVFTKVSLFGLVEGQYRLMARGETPTILGSPRGDVTAGLIQAINVIEMITGRHFVENGQIIIPERDNGDGVDVVVSTISAGGPLRMAVLGAVNPTLEGLVAQSISGLYAEIQSLCAPSYLATASAVPVSVGANVGRPSSSNGWTPDRIAREWERQLERLREIQPQAAVIVGMADGPAGPNPLQEACQLLTSFAKRHQEMAEAKDGADAQRLSVLYAGAPQYVEAVRRMLGNTTDVTRIDPLTSQSQVGQISVASGALHERNVLKQLPGYEKLAKWSSTSPVATATSLSSLVRFLAQHYSMNVTAVDIGGSTTTLMLAGEQGEFVPTVNTGVGVGAGLGAILKQVGVQRVMRWLPFSISEDEIRQFVLNHTMHPEAIPANARELQIIYAFAREAMLITAEISARYGGGWSTTDLVLGTGGVLSHAPKFGQVAMLLLDALQPKGITSLVLDRTMLIPLLGAVASISPITAVQVNENDAVSHRLGTCVIPFGNLPPGQSAVRVGLEYSNGRQVTVEVMTGSIEVIPLALHEQALLTLFPAPTVDVGLGPGERARAAEEIDGGLIGLIIDARGRPLQLPTNEMERQARLTQWAQVLGA